MVTIARGQLTSRDREVLAEGRAIASETIRREHRQSVSRFAISLRASRPTPTDETSEERDDN